MDTPGRENALLHGEERACLKGVKRQNSSSFGRRRLLIANICARSDACDLSLSSFMYNLGIKCVLKKNKPQCLITMA